MIYPYLANRLYHILSIKTRRINMVLHYNEDGSIKITMKFKGKIIEATFPDKKAYENFLSIIY